MIIFQILQRMKRENIQVFFFFWCFKSCFASIKPFNFATFRRIHLGLFVTQIKHKLLCNLKNKRFYSLLLFPFHRSVTSILILKTSGGQFSVQMPQSTRLKKKGKKLCGKWVTLSYKCSWNELLAFFKRMIYSWRTCEEIFIKSGHWESVLSFNALLKKDYQLLLGSLEVFFANTAVSHTFYLWKGGSSDFLNILHAFPLVNTNNLIAVCGCAAT